MRSWLVAIAIVMAGASARADQATTARHLLAGVRAFKDARYEEALVELRIVAKSPDAPADLAFYLGPTLVKLARYREAITVFLSSKAPRDALTDFYLGEAYYQLKLFRKARTLFGGLRSQGLGPVLDDAAARYVDAVDAAYRTPPSEAAIDYYIGQAAEDKEPIVVAELLDEARQVEALAKTRHRHVEIAQALGAAWNALGRAQAVIDVLAPEATSSPELTWQVARAYVTTNDASHGRPLLEGLVKAGGPRATDAAQLLDKLPP